MQDLSHLHKAHHEVKLTSENMENDVWASTMLREIGKTVRPAGADYLGSFVTHIYASNDFSGLTKSVNYIHQIVGKEPGTGLSSHVREFVASTAVADLAIRLRKHFNPDWDHSTTNKNDKR